MLVDDHRLIRETWSMVLNSEQAFQVLANAGSGEEAIEMATQHRPNIVLMDINMGELNGFDATKAIRKFSPDSKIIGVSMHAIPAYAKRLMQAGAVGYVTKNSPMQELIKAIKEVQNGNTYICNEMRESVFEQSMNPGSNGPDIKLLSKRELQVATLIKNGLSSKEIGTRLDICCKTVEVHRYNMLKKLQLKNAASLVNFINESGL